jgi:hypothetical protein
VLTAIMTFLLLCSCSPSSCCRHQCSPSVHPSAESGTEQSKKEQKLQNWKCRFCCHLFEMDKLTDEPFSCVVFLSPFCLSSVPASLYEVSAPRPPTAPAAVPSLWLNQAVADQLRRGKSRFSQKRFSLSQSQKESLQQHSMPLPRRRHAFMEAESQSRKDHEDFSHLSAELPTSRGPESSRSSDFSSLAATSSGSGPVLSSSRVLASSDSRRTTKKLAPRSYSSSLCASCQQAARTETECSTLGDCSCTEEQWVDKPATAALPATTEAKVGWTDSQQQQHVNILIINHEHAPPELPQEEEVPHALPSPPSAPQIAPQTDAKAGAPNSFESPRPGISEIPTQSTAALSQ